MNRIASAKGPLVPHAIVGERAKGMALGKKTMLCPSKDVIGNPHAARWDLTTSNGSTFPKQWSFIVTHSCVVALPTFDE
jgi:hypothetical protein